MMGRPVPVHEVEPGPKYRVDLNPVLQEKDEPE